MLNLTSASLAQLKQYAADNAIVITGDRRRKKSYIDAIEVYQASIDAWYTAVPLQEEAVDVALDEAGNLQVLMSFQEEDTSEVSLPRPAANAFAPILLLLVQLVLGAIATCGLLIGGALWAAIGPFGWVFRSFKFPSILNPSKPHHQQVVSLSP